jgi:O-antigen ligase
MATVSQNKFGLPLPARIRSAVERYQTRLIRLAIVLGVLVAAFVLGYVAAKKNPLYALLVALVPVLLIGLDRVVRRRQLGPLVILLAALFVPWSLPTGTESRLVISLVLTTLFVTIWVLQMLVEQHLRLETSVVNAPLLGFMGVTAFSLIWSNVYRDPLVLTWKSFPIVQIASAFVMIMLPGAFLLVANQVHDLRLLKSLTAMMLLAGGLGLIRQYSNVNLPVNTGGLFSMWIITLSTGLAFFNRQLSWKVRGLLLALAAAWIIWGVALHISWLAGWLPGLVAFGVLCFIRSKKLTLVLILLLLAVVVVKWDYFDNALHQESQISGITRLVAWEVNWRITSQHWLFGTGPAGYAAYYMTYLPSEGMATHNNYLDILAQTGVSGFILCLWFFGALVWLGCTLVRRLKGRGDFQEGLANAALAGTLGCIVVMGFGDWLFPFAYTQTIAGFDYAVYNWIFMGTLLVVDRLTTADATQ